ncbi:PP2C family serine/threonine-protein phosphatase [Mycolicibacterium fortuitum]|uniref:PP2C family serine/threonine-protein phosphatase n=1 Tax=Mycolicibacterium fortuitum TaxID=1766 RepID=UPI003AB0C4F0
MTGSQHIKNSLGCDDAFAYGQIGDFIVAAVADGAGSVSGTSAWGSYTACQTVVDLCMQPAFIDGFKAASVTDADAMMRWLFTRARDKVVKRAEAMGLPVGRLATTLSVAIAGRELLVLGQIGDGIIASETDDSIATHLIEEKDEYANVTWFIHSDEAFEKSFRTSAHVGATAFGLSTDGMAYKITDIVTGDPFEPFFRGAWQRVRTGAGAADFAALLRGIEDDQTGDDKTMVLAAMQWVEDAYYPSARPVFRSQVSSPPPPVPRATAPSAPQEEAPPRFAAPVDDAAPLAAPDVERPVVPAIPDGGAGDSRERGRHRWRRRRADASAVPSESKSGH